MLDAGRLRHRVALQSQVETQDSSGDIEVTWVTQATVWAAIEPLSAREFIAAQSTQSEVTGKLVIRFRRDVQAKWRGVHQATGEVYNIRGVLADKDYGNEYLTLPYSSGVNDGR